MRSKGNHCWPPGAVALRVGLEGWQVDDGEAGGEILAALGCDQEMLDEQGMPGIFADDAGLQFMAGISTGNQILDEEVAVSGVDEEILLEGLEMGPGHGAVVVPPDGVFGGGVAHDEFVLGAAAGVAAGGDYQAAAFGHLGFAPHDGEFVKLGGAGIP